jgi:hypothetical protein
MNLRRTLSLLIALVLLFLVVKESREPHLWLFVEDLLHPKPPPLQVHLPNGLELRLYADPRPHTGKVARLQKGLVLVQDGEERIEEGFGFGLPLIQFNGQAYLSRVASVQQMGDTLVKHYEMDTVDTPSGFLRRKYEPVPSIGTVVISYTLASGRGDAGASASESSPQAGLATSTVRVTADFSGLLVAWTQAYLMNEQGARFFTRYEEPGLAVEGKDFGKWQSTLAPRGCIVAGDRSVRFCVETREPGQKYYGRERYNQFYWVGMYALSWAGIDLELQAPPDSFEYWLDIQSADLNPEAGP